MQESQQKREQWASKIGLVLAMAGNAVGLGNFLRFPMQAANNGGGAFMIPYIVALLFLGIPLMFVEWAMGRYGGSKGQATMPGIFALIKNNKLFRWLGVLGVWIPLMIASYYCFIESWTLGFSFYSIFNQFPAGSTQNSVVNFFKEYKSIQNIWGYVFFLTTIAINGWILYRGISRGIEKVAKVMMPLLFLFAIILVVRVFTLPVPDPVNHPDWNVMNGLGYIWNPDFSKIGKFSIWVAAAGQIFFTLSLGMGAIACYASYVKKDDDVVASGIATAMTNETCEVILGGSIAIPLGVAFFGYAGMLEISRSEAFGLGFVTMPLIFSKLPLGNLLGALWFILLFFAGITSSIAMGQIVVAFLEEIVGFSRQKSVLITMSCIFILAQFAIFGKGALFEMDDMAGTLGLTLFALLEVIIWVHVFGIDKSWKELMQGSKIKLWVIIKYITAFVTPVYLAVILVGWLLQDGKNFLLMTDVASDQVIPRWIARGVMLFVFLLIGWFSTHNMHKTESREEMEVRA